MSDTNAFLVEGIAVTNYVFEVLKYSVPKSSHGGSRV